MGRNRLTPRSALGERLVAAVAWSDLENVVAFRAATGLTSATYRNADVGSSSPRVEVVAEWASILDVSPAWLAFGGVYPAPERRGHCARVLRRLPSALVEVGRLGEGVEDRRRREPTPAEWATILSAWLAHSRSDLPLLEGFLAETRERLTDEDLHARAVYPGLADFMSRRLAPRPTNREFDLLRQVRFPLGMDVPPEVYADALAAIRARPPRATCSAPLGSQADPTYA